LIGHVPPARVNSKESWDETCWQKYALWERQYRDVILGSFYGHMNIDHFMLHDFKQIKSGEAGLLEDGEVTVASASDYLLDLRRAFSKLPSPPSQKKAQSLADYIDADEEEDSLWQKFRSVFAKSKKGGKNKKPKSDKQKYLDKIGGKYAERYSVNLVSPSVVPNYFPTIRVFEYNITGLENLAVAPVRNPSKRLSSAPGQQPLADSEMMNDEAYLREVETAIKRKHKKKGKDALKKKKRKYKFKVPKGPPKGSQPGPAYRPQPLTLTGYVQYFANLTRINNDFVTDSVSDNATHSVFGLDVGFDGNVEASKWKEGKHHGHQGKKPRPEPHPNEFRFEVEYATSTDKKYKLKDLTVRSFVDLARRIGRGSPKSKELGEDVFEDEDVDNDYDSSDDEYDNGDIADDNVDEDDEDESEDETDVETLGKKHKHKKKKHIKNSTWFTFVQRAFVGTMDPHEIEGVFGAQVEDAEIKGEREVLEL